MFGISTYVMSDVHGCFAAFQKMLRKISFGPEDQLIMAGDYIDRGSQNYEMLKWIETKPERVMFLRGNHEERFIRDVQAMCDVQRYESQKNDGKTSGLDCMQICQMTKETYFFFDYYESINKLVREQKVTLEQLSIWKELFEKMPYHYEITIHDTHYMIIHAGYIDENEFRSRGLNHKNKYGKSYLSQEDFFVNAREEAYEFGGKKNYTIIAGHTPTVFKNYRLYNHGQVLYKENEKKNCRFYNIDCGYVFRDKDPEGKLACIRLDDEQIFYVTESETYC